MRICRLCESTIPTDGALINGSVYHRRCYDQLLHMLSQRSSEMSVLIHEKNKSLGFIGSLTIAFSKNRRQEDDNRRRSLSAQISQTKQEIQNLRISLRQIHDVWPIYPPDWKDRQLLVRQRDFNCCVNCGAWRDLHIHHIRAISEGGTHHVDNLVLLCNACHSEAHGGRQFQIDRDIGHDETTVIQNKVALINTALTKRQDIQIRYRKADGSITNRQVTPRDLRKLTTLELQKLRGSNFYKVNKEGRLCLFGYCHLRQADRVFAIDRILRINLTT